MKRVKLDLAESLARSSVNPVRGTSEAARRSMVTLAGPRKEAHSRVA